MSFVPTMSAARHRMSRHRCGTAVSSMAAALLAGCADGPMSTLDPAGPGAELIARVWWVMAVASVVILAGVVALALLAVYRRPDRRPQASSRLYIIGGGLVFPAITLVLLLAYGIHSGHALLPLPSGRDVFRVEVRGHQWWWEVRYPDVEGETLHAANELHIPAGRPVDVHVSTEDVVHSFWIPRLGGKIDAIPGRTNVIRLEASGPGTFRGQCAEFCGAQHSRMALHVEAHDEADLAARLALLAGTRERLPIGDDGPGSAAFRESCAACHSRDAHERSTGPNLADLPYRATLGAGTSSNGADALRNWLRRHQSLKPGNRMPPHDDIDPETLDLIVDYVGASR